MFASSLALWPLAFLYQFVRFALVTVVAYSNFKSWILWLVSGLLAVDLVVLRALLRAVGFDPKDGCIVPLGNRDPWGLRTIGYVGYLCAPAFSAAFCLMSGTQLLISNGTNTGPIPIHEVGMHPNAGVFEFRDAELKIHLLGAVKYRVTSKVTEYYYAAPLVEKSWSLDQPVAVWAILSERDLEASDLSSRKFGYVIPASNLHHPAFIKAVANAEVRSSLLSTPNSVLVGLSALCNGATNGRWTLLMLIASVHFVTSLLFLPYSIALFSEESDDRPSSSVRATPLSGLKAGSQDPTTRITGTSEIQQPNGAQLAGRRFSQTRRFWFLTHLGLFAGSAAIILTCQTVSIYLVVFMATLGIEIRQILRSFPTGRTSVRFGILLGSLVLSQFWGLVLFGVAAWQRTDIEGQSAANTVTLNEEFVPRKSTFLEFRGEHRLRGDLAGYFFAPNETASTWWVVPVVSAKWTGDRPVSVWLLTTNRDKEADLKTPLHYVRVQSRPVGIRIRSALEDAVNYYGLTSSEDAVIVTRVRELKDRESEAGGFIVLAVFLVVLGWAFASCFWVNPDTQPMDKVAIL